MSSSSSSNDIPSSNEIVIFLPQSADPQVYNSVDCDLIPMPRLGGVRIIVPQQFVPSGLSTRVHFAGSALFEDIIRNVRIINGDTKEIGIQTDLPYNNTSTSGDIKESIDNEGPTTDHVYSTSPE